MSAVRNVAKEFQKEPTVVGESEKVPTIEVDEVATGIALDTEVYVVAESEVPTTSVDDGIVALNHNGDDVPSTIEGIRDPEFLVFARSEVPTIAIDAGIAAANQAEVDDAPLLTEGIKDQKQDVIAGSGVPSIEVDEGVVAANSKGDDEHVLTEGRDYVIDVAT